MTFRFASVTRVLAPALLLASPLALAACAAPPPLTAREPTPGAAHFRVMTYNVHRGRADDAPTLEAIGEPDADIVCLQEPTSAWERKIRARWAERYPHMLFHPREDAGGLAILSKFPLTDDGVLSVDDEWHPAWHAIAHTPAGDLQVLNVHLRAAFDGKSNAVSSYVGTTSDHLTEVQSYVGEAHENVPAIVLGDFNEGPRGDTLTWLREHGFENALPLFQPGQYTWRAPSLGDSLDMSIDHVLFDGSFAPLDAWVERTGGSDHLPVLAHLELRDPRDPSKPELTPAATRAP